MYVNKGNLSQADFLRVSDRSVKVALAAGQGSLTFVVHLLAEDVQLAGKSVFKATLLWQALLVVWDAAGWVLRCWDWWLTI